MIVLTPEQAKALAAVLVDDYPSLSARDARDRVSTRRALRRLGLEIRAAVPRIGNWESQGRVASVTITFRIGGES